MEIGDGGAFDFMEWLGFDASTMVLKRLDDIADLVSASVVSRFWRQFVIANGFFKELVLRSYPEASTFAQVIEVRSFFEPIENALRNSTEWESLELENRVYALLGQHLKSCVTIKDCIMQPIAASSTDNYPDESIMCTVDPNNLLIRNPSYWSSKGAKDSQAPETLTYKLSSNLCVIDQINIKPFQAYFQYGFPLYSAHSVRFKMGHCTLLQETSSSKPDASQQSSDNDYTWTYISPTYPMIQENLLQSFKLPRPVLCTGGILQIEFLGRVQKQEVDELYYICISYVQVLGRPCPPAFDVGHFDNSGCLALKYFPHARNSTSCETSGSRQLGSSGLDDTERVSFGWHAVAERLRLRAAHGWHEMILGTLVGRASVDDDSDEDEGEGEPLA